MKTLIALTYYRPWTSGLTIYAERLAKGLAARGHHVTVLTSQYEPSLARLERLDRVRVVRAPVLLRVSKGVIMPTFGLLASHFSRWADVLSIHLPQFDAAGIALRGRLMRKPTVLTFHCDLQLPAGLFNRVVNTVVDTANLAAGRLADAIVSYTQDYATHSAYLSRFAPKVRVIPPPVEVGSASEAEVQAFRVRHNLEGRKVIGMAARLAAEKGVEYLLEAAPTILEKYPGTRFLFAGQCEKVLGEEAYERKIAPLLTALGDRWTFLGVLEPDAMAAFFKSCDVTVLPSINSTETFGLVQIESMICGTPTVASGLPGVREPVRITGMGKVVPPRDPARLAQAVLEILADRPRFVQPAAKIAGMFSPDATAARYEALFEEIAKSKM